MADAPFNKPKSVAIRKGATQEGLVAELIGLLEGVTADGVISDEEVEQLRRWLNWNRNGKLPGIEFLSTLIEQILLDGKVTDEERKVLYQAVERILPPESRANAKARRQAFDLASKAAAADEKLARRTEEAAERAKNRVAASFDFMMAGVTHDNRAAIVDKYLSVGYPVYLRREPNNQWDPNAVQVLTVDGYIAGYVPREDAASMARFLDVGFLQRAYCKKILQGKIVPTPIVQASLYRPEADIGGATAPASVPALKPPPLPEASNGPGCLLWLAGLVLLFVVISLFSQ